jgi:primosomal replication protein N
MRKPARRSPLPQQPESAQLSDLSGLALATNQTQLAGRLLERGALRYTPAGIAVLEFVVGHVSQQIEAETPRTVECEMACIAAGTLAKLLSKGQQGDSVKVSGFLAARSLKRRTPVLHVTTIEFVEGIENGI